MTAIGRFEPLLEAATDLKVALFGGQLKTHGGLSLTPVIAGK
jgi:hypothetical protein